MKRITLVDLLALAALERSPMRLQIFLTLPILGTILFPSAVLAMAPPPASSGKIQLNVRDLATPYSFRARITLINSDNQAISQQTDEIGYLRLDLAPGEYRIEVSADGYEPGKTGTYVTAGRVSGMTIFLNPAVPPAEEAPEVQNAKIRPGNTLIEGYIVDLDTGKPLPGVELHLTKAGMTTHTDARGYYSLSVPTPPWEPSEPISYDTLTSYLPGYKTSVTKDILIFGDDSGLLFDMEKGAGVRVVDAMPHLQREIMKD